ncbi:hypothetical protein [Desulfotruncus alcoholivorax]|uniref:hypothetical protein n=1 Tax=Desulfotruncus alcoholivorax TaxID=265477 RepID=UPI00040F8E30|nr:hypothetical protein [Desulfotruncus alcoholivorax]
MKSDTSKSKGGRTKSLHIKLPADHPVFLLPEGERSRVAREWMEQGRQVQAVMETISRELADIRKALNNIEPQSRSHIGNPKDINAGNKSTERCKNDINPAIFLSL